MGQVGRYRKEITIETLRITTISKGEKTRRDIYCQNCGHIVSPADENANFDRKTKEIVDLCGDGQIHRLTDQPDGNTTKKD